MKLNISGETSSKTSAMCNSDMLLSCKEIFHIDTGFRTARYADTT